MTKSHVALLAILPLGLLASCAADENYATPEKTVETYAGNAHVLKNSIDIPAWNFAWNALSASSQKWFDENWEEICARPGYREACGNQTNPDKQRMVAFGAAIASRGPGRGCTAKDVTVNGDTAEATVNNWDGTLHLVKEKGVWKIDGLFGVEKLASNNW